ncbi:hypothetical protein [Diaminobutyricibacter sp. McL0608]|uniref:hypothetical protein n=1 Tax=Leifsonia sp. McL0608 TaxID=3143537 RepID=UPI0031F2E67F
MAEVTEWWNSLEPEAREWILTHQRERISWHILPELQQVGADLRQADPSKSVFQLTDEAWRAIAEIDRSK